MGGWKAHAYGVWWCIVEVCDQHAAQLIACCMPDVLRPELLVIVWCLSVNLSGADAWKEVSNAQVECLCGGPVPSVLLFRICFSNGSPLVCML